MNGDAALHDLLDGATFAHHPNGSPWRDAMRWKPDGPVPFMLTSVEARAQEYRE